MTIKDLVLLLLSVFANVSGQVFLKTGALKLADAAPLKIFSLIQSIVMVPELLVGLTFYALGAIAYILLLSKVDLSVVGPATSLVYVCSVLIGYFVFGETISSNRLLGLGLIVCGVILVVWQR
ncbi:MAG: EamA family transporter [Cyanobacteria bacterium P01_B01_bin.77]